MCRLSCAVPTILVGVIVVALGIWGSLKYNPSCDDYCKWFTFGGVLFVAYVGTYACFKFEYTPDEILCDGTKSVNYRDTKTVHSNVTFGQVTYAMEMPVLWPCRLLKLVQRNVICCPADQTGQPKPPMATAMATAPMAPMATAPMATAPMAPDDPKV